jgi:hypothetical protein
MTNSLNSVFVPAMDGLNHINIFLKAKTSLGRWMSNWAHTPFTHLIHGKFASIEGFWYWLSSRQDCLRDLSGVTARNLGKVLPRLFIMKEAEFRKEIRYAIKMKLETNPDMRLALKLSTLPFTHYYSYPNKLIRLPDYQWVVDFWTDERKRLRGEIVW